MEQKKYIVLPIGKLKPNPENPRVVKDNKFKQLVKSIQEFPQMLEIRPIVVNADMIVLGGNMRLKACKDAGLTEVPTIIVDDFTPDQEKEFIIKDNLGYGEWDFNTLQLEWDMDKLQDWGLDLPGFDVDGGNFDEKFNLPEGDKAPFEQITFTLSTEQAERIKWALQQAKKTEDFDYLETFGNTNTNGNAIYLIVAKWVEQNIS
jgi:hypothetical protein